jgi:8-oxo-dGTP pyrophosphatase MutT (NUDIX family)
MSIVVILDANGQKHRVDSNNLIFRKAVYGLYIQNNKLLMVKDKISKKWEFPGGGMENNESPLEGLKREFFEETGLTILDTRLSPDNLVYSGLELFFDINSNQAWKTKRDFFFISKISGSIIVQSNKKDIKQARFFSFKNLPFLKLARLLKKFSINF